ncbi:MAG: hypothetical protein AAF337_02255 [Pseudomonadota bacterium]
MRFDYSKSAGEYDVIQDRETYELAFAMVDKLGPSALYEALDKVEYHEKNENEAHAYLWRRVEAAINVLLSEEPRGAIH